MNSHTGKMRNVFGELQQQKIENIKSSESISEGFIADANNKYLAISWLTSGGGAVAVLEPHKYGRLNPDIPLIRGHTSPVVELRLSPLNPNILATGSDDSTVKIWELSEDCFTKDTTEFVQSFSGHTKKITSINFHPCVSELIATTSLDGNLHIWNILNSNSIAKFNCGEGIYSSDWNHNGSLIGVTTKEKLIKIFDPRKNQQIHSVQGFEGAKAQKMLFMGNSDYFLTTGFSKTNERQIRVFDLRNVEKPVQSFGVDNNSSTQQPYYDHDSGLLFLAGRGESTVKYFEFANGSFKKAAEFSTAEPSKSSIFLQKRFVNYNKCELASMLKLTKNWVSYVHFNYPKKVEGFDSTLYPDCASGEASNTLENWLNGIDTDPTKKPINEINPIEASSPSMTFEKEESKASNSNSNVSESNASSKELDALRVELAEAKVTIESLASEKLSLESTVSQLREEINSLMLNLAEKNHHEPSVDAQTECHVSVQDSQVQSESTAAAEQTDA